MARNSALIVEIVGPVKPSSCSHGTRGHGVKEGVINWACRKAWIGNPCLCFWSWVVTHEKSPNPQPLYDSYLQLWQLYLKLGLNVHILRVQLHATSTDNIFLWRSVQSFCTAFRFGKKNTVTLSICAPSDLLTSEFYHVQSKIRYHITGQLWGTSSAWDQSELAGSRI